MSTFEIVTPKSLLPWVALEKDDQCTALKLKYLL